MHFQENTVFDLGQVTWDCAQYPLNHVTYTAAKFEVSTSIGFRGDAFTRKYNIWSFLGSRSHQMLSSSSLYIMWPMQMQSLVLLHLTAVQFEVATSNGIRRICIYKKIHYLTLDLRGITYHVRSRSHEMLLSILCIMWPVHLQKSVSMIRKYHNPKLQTNPRHCEKGPHNNHETKFAVRSKVVVLLLLTFCLLLPHCGSLQLFYVLLFVTFCPF